MLLGCDRRGDAALHWRPALRREVTSAAALEPALCGGPFSLGGRCGGRGPSAALEAVQRKKDYSACWRPTLLERYTTLEEGTAVIAPHAGTSRSILYIVQVGTAGCGRIPPALLIAEPAAVNENREGNIGDCVSRTAALAEVTDFVPRFSDNYCVSVLV